MLSKTSSIQDTSKSPAATAKSTSGSSTKSTSSRSSSNSKDKSVSSNLESSGESVKSSSEDVKKKKKVVTESISDIPSPYADMTVSALKDRCRTIGLPVSGTKAELLSRLTDR